MINIFKQIEITLRIKSLISLKVIASSVPTKFYLDNDDTMTNPYDIARAFNNYFGSIAAKLQ